MKEREIHRVLQASTPCACQTRKCVTDISFDNLGIESTYKPCYGQKNVVKLILIHHAVLATAQASAATTSTCPFQIAFLFPNSIPCSCIAGLT